MPLRVTEFPSCCALKIIHELDCLGKTDAYSQRETKKFDTKMPRGGCRGEYLTSAIVVISDDRHDPYGDEGMYEAQKKFLKTKGWICLATFPGNEVMGQNTLELWGSPKFRRVTK